MLTCVPPFLSQDMVVHLLKNIIKAFLATFIGIPYLSICAEKNEIPQLSNTIVNTKDRNDVAEIHCNQAVTVKQEQEHEQHVQDAFEEDCEVDLQRSI